MTHAELAMCKMDVIFLAFEFGPRGMFYRGSTEAKLS